MDKIQDTIVRRVYSVIIISFVAVIIMMAFTLIWHTKENEEVTIRSITDTMINSYMSLSKNHGLLIKTYERDNALSSMAELIINTVNNNDEVIEGRYWNTVNNVDAAMILHNKNIIDPDDNYVYIENGFKKNYKKYKTYSEEIAKTTIVQSTTTMYQIYTPIFYNSEFKGLLEYDISTEQLTDSIHQEKKKHQYFLFLMLLAIIVGAILILFLIYKKIKDISFQITQPLTELTQFSDKMADGDYQKQLMPEVNNEIGQLFSSYEIMRKRINRIMKELNTTVSELKSEKKIAYQAQANKARAEQIEIFLACLSHDLRTPLNSIILLSENIDEIQDDSKRTQYLQDINQNGHLLLSYFDDIIDLVSESHPSATKQPKPKTTFNLYNKFIETFKVVSMQYQEKDIELRYYISSTIPDYVYTHQKKLYRIMLNLMTNAMKFTNKGSVMVIIDYNHITKMLYFTVQDSGIGIKKEEMDNIFLPYYKTNNEKYVGSGLGLPSVKNFIDELDGNIEYSSTPNIGTTVNVEIPIEERQSINNKNSEKLEYKIIMAKGNTLFDELNEENQLKTLQINPTTIESQLLSMNNPSNEPTLVVATDYDLQLFESRSDNLHKYLKNNAQLIYVSDSPYNSIPEIDITKAIVCKDKKSINQAISLYINNTQALNKKIVIEDYQNLQVSKLLNVLCIEDNITNQRVIEMLSDKYQFSCLFAENGKEAMKLLEVDNSFHVILVDKKMPVMDGETFFTHYKESNFINSAQKVYMLTSDVLSISMKPALEQGFDLVLTKPVNEIKLISALQEAEKYINVAEELKSIPPINHVTKNQLRSMGENAEQFVFESFVENTVETLKQLHTEEKNGNLGEFTHLLHRLKSGSMQVGAERLFLCAQHYEKNPVFEGVYSECQHYYDEFKQQFQEEMVENA